MGRHNFKKMKIWSLGMDIVDMIYLYLQELPSIEKFNLTSQMSRSAVSIPSNIAEGAGRSGLKDQLRFFEFSLSSSYELETQLLICQRRNYGNLSLLKEILEKIDEEQKMLIGFTNKLKREKI